jgi:phosphatidylserine decarboxylase
MFHKEGHKIILITLCFVVALSLGADYLVDNSIIRGGIIIAAVVLLILILQFFRNPKRNFSTNDTTVLSPVDGKVVVIEKVFEKEFYKEERLQVSVFMSPINVHVTRYPVSGEVVFSKYHPGKFLVAWHPKSSEENERTTIVVNNKSFGNVLHRQIAGVLARRIVNYAKEGQQVAQASDSGFIKFGSRVDIFLPVATKLDVTLNQIVKGGMTSAKIEEKFTKAVEIVNDHKQPFPADTILKLYAYYKIATNAPHKPGESKEALITAFKTNALFQNKHLSEDEAKLLYIETANNYFLYGK